MSVDTATSELRAGTQREASRDLKALVDDLPDDARECFIQELIEAALEQQATGDGGRLKRALLSLEISPVIHESDGFVAGLQAADADTDKETVDFATYVMERRGHRSNPA